jgi:hypothetical protein
MLLYFGGCLMGKINGFLVGGVGGSPSPLVVS